jgi:hypothetical protein
MLRSSMGTDRALTLRLEAADYRRLQDEAARLGLPPATLARVYVRNGLYRQYEAESRRRRDQTLAALDALEAFREELEREGYPTVDSLQILRESREELESRPAL